MDAGEDIFWVSLRLTYCFNYRYIAVNRNSALTTEKNDILNFLGSYFLSISWREVSPVLYQIP